jgi:hypothetical protein
MSIFEKSLTWKIYTGLREAATLSWETSLLCRGFTLAQKQCRLCWQHQAPGSFFIQKTVTGWTVARTLILNAGRGSAIAGITQRLLADLEVRPKTAGLIIAGSALATYLILRLLTMIL